MALHRLHLHVTSSPAPAPHGLEVVEGLSTVWQSSLGTRSSDNIAISLEHGSSQESDLETLNFNHWPIGSLKS